MNAGTTAKNNGEEHVYLLGHTPFKQFLDFMATEPIDAKTVDRKQIADEWRAANDYMRELQQTEASWADHPPVQPAPKNMEALLARVHEDPIFQKAFTAVPVDIGLVELDRLVVRQKTINLTHVKRLKDRLGPNPTQETVYRHCLPFDHPTAAHRVGYVSNNTYVFVSESNDIRFLDSLVLRPQQVNGYQPHGPLAGVVGLVVGFGSNYLNAIASEGRLILNNGSHRAYALRQLGVTHVPCVVQNAKTRDELNVVAAGALRRNPDLYLKELRPPVMKDYFDPRVIKIVRLAPTARHVRVHFSVETVDVPE